MEYITKNEQETIEIGKELGGQASAGDIFCLYGDLGAGKTVFAKGFALGMGIRKQITSPTFALVNEYEGRLRLYHFDAYRLGGQKDALCFDFEEYFDYGGVCLIEWAENIAEIIPESANRISVVRTGDNERSISFVKGQGK